MLPAETPCADIITTVLKAALTQQASDIHFEPFADTVEVRFRIHGVLSLHQRLCPSQYAHIVARLKTMAQLDIAQTLRPQDGRLQFISHKTYHIRIHTCPTLHHEKVVLRFMGDASDVPTLSQAGLTCQQIDEVCAAVNKLEGLVICTGPTGSGKSTTLYALLNGLLTAHVAITTIEDPIEIPIPGISQIPIQMKQGLDYAHLLKAVLRQDPDVIMVGEIRDSETAAMAVRAALTGHLVLTSMHTRNASTAVTRLLNLGIEAHDLADALSLVIAQRLVRALCQCCCGSGCEHCDHGFQGRIGIFECLHIESSHQHLIRTQQPLYPSFNLADAESHHVKAGLITRGQAHT